MFQFWLKRLQKYCITNSHVTFPLSLMLTHVKISQLLKKSVELNNLVAQNKKVQQKRNSSKYLSAFLQAIRHQSRHPG